MALVFANLRAIRPASFFLYRLYLTVSMYCGDGANSARIGNSKGSNFLKIGFSMYSSVTLVNNFYNIIQVVD